MPTTEIEKFAKFVKEKRTALGMSSKDLAFAVFGEGKGKPYISELESGTRKGVTIEMMGKILTALNSEIKYNEF
jgi:transcriptional regulator with XRE-family HTH domain